MSYAPSQDQRWDHRRDLTKHEWRPGDPMTHDQRAAVFTLIGYSEAIAESGLLGEQMENRLRKIVADTLTAFNMPTKAERVRP
jgi:hypothetical protein